MEESLLASCVFRTNRQARHLRLTVYRDGRVVVTRPPRISLLLAKHFVQQNWSKIVAGQKKLNQRPASLLSSANRADFQRQRAAAFDLAQNLIEKYTELTDCRPIKVVIRNNKTRWGSCSSTRTISLHYLITELPAPLAEYIVVHELCHLRQMNHSPAFWRLVESILPDYRELRRNLRRISKSEKMD